jgi:PAS domain S-box-containing protein
VQELNKPPSQLITIQSLINELSQEVDDLPVEKKERIESTLEKIRSCLFTLIPTYGEDNQFSQLNKVKKTLAVSEAKYRELAESLSDPFIAYDNNLRIIFRNKAAIDATMIPNELAIGKTFAEVYPDLAGGEIHKLYQRTLETHQSQRYVTHWKRPIDGQKFVYDLSLYPTSDGLIAFSKNITEHVQTELKSREAHDQAIWMARFPDENPNPVARVSIDGKVLYCNKASAEPVNWSLEVGKYLPAPFLSLLEEVNKLGKQIEHDLQVGEKFYSITFMPFPNDQYINLYGLDITDRKYVEIALEESGARERARANELMAIMDAAPAIIWISRDPDCGEMVGNRFSYEFLNITQGENVSKTAPQENVAVQRYCMEKDGRVVPPSELPMQIAAATGKPERDYMADIVYEDGTRFHLFGNINPLFDEDGKPYGAIAVFVDLTTLRRLEGERVMAMAEIEVQRRLMDQREQERQAIARDLHDGPIQTLSSSVFHLQMIKEAFPDQALHQDLNRIGMDIKKSIQEIRDVLYELRPPALMHFGLTRMIQMHQEDLSEKYPNITIELDVMEEKGKLSDPVRLALFRIYQAGVNNIVRHSGADKARIEFRVSEDAFLLQLSDNGKGFSKGSDFTQFTRNGHFGLVGMKERAEAIGGEFSISSEPDKGTIILVKGPILVQNQD